MSVWMRILQKEIRLTLIFVVVDVVDFVVANFSSSVVDVLELTLESSSLVLIMDENEGFEDF